MSRLRTVVSTGAPWAAGLISALVVVLVIGLFGPAVGDDQKEAEALESAAAARGIDLAEVRSQVATAASGALTADAELPNLLELYGDDYASFVNEYVARCMAAGGLQKSWTPLAKRLPGVPVDAAGVVALISPPDPSFAERQAGELDRNIGSPMTEGEMIARVFDGGPESQAVQKLAPEWSSAVAACTDKALEAADGLGVPPRDPSTLTRQEAATLLALNFDYSAWLASLSSDSGVSALADKYDSCMADAGFRGASPASPWSGVPAEDDQRRAAALADYTCGLELRPLLGARLTASVAEWLDDPVALTSELRAQREVISSAK